MRRHDDDFEDEEKGMSRWIPSVVLLGTIAGFIVLAWYAYNSGRNAVKEEDLLVVEADSSPLKEKPEDPGGMKIPNQDKTVFETFSGNNEPAKVERILPPPEEPVSKRELTERTEIARKIHESIKPAEPYNSEEKPDFGISPDNSAVEEVSTPNIKSEEVVLSEKQEEKPAIKEQEAEKTVQKPAPEAKISKQTSGVKVQLGAFSSESEARQNWTKIQKKFSSLSGKSPIIVRAEVKGRVFYRLRVGGFGSVDEARKFCKSLSAKGQACIIAS